jgi:hypothetical protein
LVKESDPTIDQNSNVQNKEIITEGITLVHDKGGGYVEFENRLFQKDALKALRPDLFSAKADIAYKSSTNFGTNFPKIASKGDVFVRVDVLPNRVFKFDGVKWIEINKEKTDTYLYDQSYLQHLVEKIGSGEYDTDLLTQAEEEQIRNYLNGNQNT